ncbi:S4 domain-containing protein [Brevinema andersonii]|uniref:S4 domain-containing protein n=1 Tax=Brevinema andersonii TaxID=34097 RepID=A0A1I1DT20_BREAD|nr:S4 domain-containing protein [Brevinema andersonii]SFB78051.1 S4 domain-containing protein [Brevinema andersonii]
MRLDKWLKVTLIFKQRSKVVSYIENNKIRVNNEPVKASKTVKIGDVISIQKEIGVYHYTVLRLSEKNVTTVEAKEMYALQMLEQQGSEDEKFIRKIEKDRVLAAKKDWNKMYDNKKQQRKLRARKYNFE